MQSTVLCVEVGITLTKTKNTAGRDELNLQYLANPRRSYFGHKKSCTPDGHTASLKPCFYFLSLTLFLSADFFR
jgi:hypothetical protein